jgi:hypothetical protein
MGAQKYYSLWPWQFNLANKSGNFQPPAGIG